MKTLAVVPARIGSSRFPGKVLEPINGRPMLAHVCERARAAVGDVVVATPDRQIVDACSALGLAAVLTSANNTNGTEAAAEVAAAMSADVYVLAQGDEPMVSPVSIRAVAEAVRFPHSVVNAMCVISDPADVLSPNVVKVVCDLNRRAIAFSRAPIPHPFSGEASWDRVVGLYAFAREPLLMFPHMAVGPLERAERVELLRYLENDQDVQMVRVHDAGISVDTPEDLELARRLMSVGENPI